MVLVHFSYGFSSVIYFHCIKCHGFFQDVFSSTRSLSFQMIKDSWRTVPGPDKEFLTSQLATGARSWTEYKKALNVCRCKALFIDAVRVHLKSCGYISVEKGNLTEEQRLAKEEHQLYVRKK